MPWIKQNQQIQIVSQKQGEALKIGDSFPGKNSADHHVFKNGKPYDVLNPKIIKPMHSHTK
jgi:hypothetical protein